MRLIIQAQKCAIPRMTTAILKNPNIPAILSDKFKYSSSLVNIFLSLTTLSNLNILTILIILKTLNILADFIATLAVASS